MMLAVSVGFFPVTIAQTRPMGEARKADASDVQQHEEQREICERLVCLLPESSTDSDTRRQPFPREAPRVCHRHTQGVPIREREAYEQTRTPSVRRWDCVQVALRAPSQHVEEVCERSRGEYMKSVKRACCVPISPHTRQTRITIPTT